MITWDGCNILEERNGKTVRIATAENATTAMWLAEAANCFSLAVETAKANDNEDKVKVRWETVLCYVALMAGVVLAVSTALWFMWR